jgi:hypothetical protein
MNLLQHRANEAMSKIDKARTPQEKAEADREGHIVKADMEKYVADLKAVAIFKATKPQSTNGMWKSDPVSDKPIFMTGPAGTKITAPIALPDGTRATPNHAGQIVVPATAVPAMIARGFVRANSVMTPLNTIGSDPAQLNTMGERS